MENDRNRNIVQLIASKTEEIVSNGFASDTVENQKDIIYQYIRSCYTQDSDGLLVKALNVLQFSFDHQFEWINSDSPRSSLDEDALSNFIIVDFFTHCCINCIHSIDDLRCVHSGVVSKRNVNQSESFSCGFKVISIHSPKFAAEKESASITSSVHRMKMDHTEVLNDPNNILWNQLGIYCWPTIMIFGPNVDPICPGPNLLFVLFGEGHRTIVKLLTDISLAFFDQTVTLSQVSSAKTKLQIDAKLSTPKVLSLQELEDRQVKEKEETSLLRFPGKVTIYNGIVCISDSGNNRIILTNFSGKVKYMVGGKESGFCDGEFSEAKFYNPQGTAFASNTIFYVADTGNHCIRKVDLKLEMVTTLVPPNFLIAGLQSPLKSPWDVCFCGPNLLLVASAGNHQIFGYFFEEMTLFGVSHVSGSFDLIAGSGREENRNNTYILKSSFAQPSGICCSSSDDNNRTVYIADSESSSIRCITAKGHVANVVGGDRDPFNLFAYGDRDGISYDVKLQHPIAVVTRPGTNQIFIADSYNNKIKVVDVITKQCRTLIGNGAGDSMGLFSVDLFYPKSDAGLDLSSVSNIARLNEPAGIEWSDCYECLFIADTNNHCIKVGHFNEQIVSKFDVHISSVQSLQSNQQNNAASTATKNVYVFEILEGCKNLNLMIFVQNIPDHVDGGTWKIYDSISQTFVIITGTIPKMEGENVINVAAKIPFVPWMSELCFEFVLYLCHNNACYRKTTKLFVKFNTCSNSSSNNEPQSKLIIDFVPDNKNYFLQE